MRYDVIIVGGDVLDSKIGIRLLEAGKSVALISEGGRPELYREFVQKGGVHLRGDRVDAVDYAADGSVSAVYTENLENTPLKAAAYILASGRFFSEGLRSDMSRVWEPVFGADVKFDPDRSLWSVDDFFAAQPFESFGVLTSPQGQVLKDGKVVANLYACASILADGQDNIELVCKKLS